MLIFLVIFFSFLLVFSYFIYPQSLVYFNTKNDFGSKLNTRKNIVLLAAYNEERYIESTIRSIIQSAKTIDLAAIYIGDDGSSDKTLEILEKLKLEFSTIHVKRYFRIGKPNIINDLVEKNKLKSSEYNLIFIDANISAHGDCFQKLNNQLNYSEVGMVGASVYPKNELSNYESEYILRENKIKSEESRAINYTLGVFGACYVMKGELFQFIPANYVTDDLYHTFSVIKNNKKALYSSEAIVYEDIRLDIANEFGRKRRYAAGNFQIIFHFWKLLIPSSSSFGFVYAYFFHKIIRWISPILFFGIWIMSLILSFINAQSASNSFILIVGTIVCLFLYINYIFHQKKKRILGLRLYYFLSMNLALLLGFFDYLKGVKTNVWNRSERV